MKKQLRVGFDLDGVLLFNPTSNLRPVVVLAKKIFFKKRQETFFIPHSYLQKLIWWLLHKSSLFVVPSFSILKKLVADKKITTYLITARYSFLEKDLGGWLKKLEVEKYFQGYFYNKNDEQPTKFKERVIKKLDLDIFVEDNWDIVNYLNSKLKGQNSKVRVFWIYNFFDRTIPYPYKFFNLKNVLSAIKKLL